MLWSLLRVASRSQRTLYQNSFLRLQNSRFSWSLSSRYVYNSSRILQFGLQQRTIFSRCFKHHNKASNTLYGAKLPLITFDSSLVHYETRRFVGTRAGYKSSLAFNTRNSTTAIYVIALVITVVGLSYLAVPLYRLFCQVSYVIISNYWKRLSKISWFVSGAQINNICRSRRLRQIIDLQKSNLG